MEKDNNIKAYSAIELRVLRACGESRTDLRRVQAKSAAELEQGVADDPDFRDIPEAWYEAAEAVAPTSKKRLSLRIDSDVIDWFKQQGPGYQSRMNAVLRAFVAHTRKKPAR
jgi:uncharacterized protein (DUF4415 family)